MIAYVVRCDVCAAEAFVPLNQDPDMAMSARGWRMRPHSKVCPDCVFALEGPKIPPSMADVPERVSTRLNRGDREGV